MSCAFFGGSTYVLFLFRKHSCTSRGSKVVFLAKTHVMLFLFEKHSCVSYRSTCISRKRLLPKNSKTKKAKQKPKNKKIIKTCAKKRAPAGCVLRATHDRCWAHQLARS